MSGSFKEPRRGTCSRCHREGEVMALGVGPPDLMGKDVPAVDLCVGWGGCWDLAVREALKTAPPGHVIYGEYMGPGPGPVAW